MNKVINSTGSQIHPDSALPSRPDYAAKYVQPTTAEPRSEHAAAANGGDMPIALHHAERRLRAISEALTGSASSTEADVMSAIESLQDADFEKEVALWWALYHSQGGSSPVGQPIRKVLGIGQHDQLPQGCIETAKRWATGEIKLNRTTASDEGEVHPDDLAVDRFATAMKAKMAASRAKGRDGWDNRELCPADRLRGMLRAHISKGDPVDVGNFAMMLHQRGERTALPLDPDLKAALEQASKTGASAAELPNGGVVFINRGEDFGDRDDLNCPGCGGSGHVDDYRAPAADAGGQS